MTICALAQSRKYSRDAAGVVSNALAGFALFFLPALLPAQVVTLDPLTVTASRTPEQAAQIPFSVVSFSGDTLRSSPAVTLDDALHSVPGFSLFRRGDSFTANPTTQGVSLRGLGPSGASRSLILLDGVPLNDPFGGWVPWSLVPRESLSAVEIVRGGGATAWGNAALGGVIQLLTEHPSTAADRIAVTAGDFSTTNAEVSLHGPVGPGAWQLLGDAFNTNGVPLVAPQNRGPIDVAAWSRHEWLTGRWQQPVGPNAEFDVTARTFSEERGNGTPYQQNRSRNNLVSAGWQERASPTFSWNATAYAEEQNFSSTFSAVNALRTAETPASNQYAVPTTAAGAAWTGTWSASENSHTSIGTDLRTVKGETREYYSYANGDFTRQRIAGGAQDFAGIFVLHEQQLAPDWRAMVGARLDYWDERDGHRHELIRATEAVTRDDHYARLDGTPFSPSAGLVWQPDPTWRVRTSVQQSFRQPTLNELYRPFRAGSVVTEANPDLKTEHARTAEIGVDYSKHNYGFTVAGFWNDLHNAVGNVTLAHGPGTFPLFGALPAGGIGRQRQNLDRIRVRGLEFGAHFDPTAALRFSLDGLLSDDRVTSAANAPTLVGKQLAEVPKRTLVAGLIWQAPAKIQTNARVRWTGAQFDDDENLLRLAPATTVDVGISRAIGAGGEIFLAIENLFSTRVETSRSTDGIFTIGPPRLARGGLRWKW